MRYTHILLLPLLLAACASVSERGAQRTWERERAQWFPNSEPGNSQPEELPEPGPAATLADYERYALSNSAGLRAAFARWKAALEAVAPARALADPRLTYGHFLRQVETRVGPQEHRFGLAQTLPWIGTLDLRGRAALQDAEIERQRFAAARSRLIYQIRATYYELNYLDRAVAITRDNLHLLTHLEEVARTGYRAGSAPHGAIIKAQIELARLEDRLRKRRDMRGPLTARFNALLSRPASAPVVVDSILASPFLEHQEKEPFDRLRADNPQLHLLNARAAREELAAALARKEKYPDLTVGLDYIATGEARATAMSSPADSGEDPLIVMASINLPLWRDQYRARQRAALERQQAVHREREETENQLAADLEQALFDWRDQERRRQLYADRLIPRAEQALAVTQQAFITGQSDFLELIDAQRTLLEFQLARIRARTDHLQRAAEIEMLIGSQPTAADPQGSADNRSEE